MIVDLQKCFLWRSQDIYIYPEKFKVTATNVHNADKKNLRPYLTFQFYEYMFVLKYTRKYLLLH